VKWLFGKCIEIPEEWEIVRLNSILQKPISYGVLVPDSDPNGVPMIRSGNIDIPNGIEKSLLLISKQLEEKYKKTRLKGGEILIALVGATIGKLTYISSTYAGYNVSRALGVLVLKDKYDSKFFEKYLKSILFQKPISIMSIGSAQPVLNLKELQQIKLILPPLQEQQKITTVLSNIDNLIINTQKIIDLTQSLKKGLMQKLLTRGIDHKKFKKISLGIYSQYIIIPEEWNVEELQKFSEHITKGATPTTYGFEWSKDPTDILFIRNECIKPNKFNLEGSLYITKKANDFLKRSKIIFGDLLISITGDIGKTCIFPSNNVQANINQHIAKVRINSKKVHSIFVSYLLNTNYYVNYFNSINQGLTHPHLSLEQIQKTIIPIPSIQEQQKIATILSNVDSQIISQIEYKEKLERLKKSLMQKLLTGQVRVGV